MGLYGGVSIGSWTPWRELFLERLCCSAERLSTPGGGLMGTCSLLPPC